MAELRALTAWQGKEDELWRTVESLENGGWQFDHKDTQDTDYGTYIICVLIKPELTLLKAAKQVHKSWEEYIYPSACAEAPLFNEKWMEWEDNLRGLGQAIEREEQIQKNNIQIIAQTLGGLED